MKENLKVQIQNKPAKEPVHAPISDGASDLSDGEGSLDLSEPESERPLRQSARNKNAPTEKKEKSLGLLC